MKKRTLAIALSVIAVAAFAECKLFFKNTKPTDMSVSISSPELNDNVNSFDNAIIADSQDFSELKHEYNGMSASVFDYNYIASELLTNLDKIEKLSGFSAKCNIDISVEENGETFYKVVERNYSSTSDVERYLSMNLTDSIIDERYKNITGGDSPVLKDINGNLYIRKNKDKSNGFEWKKDENGKIKMEILDSGSGQFTVKSSGYTIKIINDDSLWKVESIN